MSALEEGIISVLSTVPGKSYRSEYGDAVILLAEDPYIVHVDKEGNTRSAYLTTITVSKIASVMDLTEGDVAGWTTGWDA